MKLFENDFDQVNGSEQTPWQHWSFMAVSDISSSTATMMLAINLDCSLDKAKYVEQDSPSTTMSSFTGLYLIVKSCSKNLRRQCYCSDVWMCCSVNEHKLFWSVLMMNLWPMRQWWNLASALVITYISCAYVDSLCMWGPSFHARYAIDCLFWPRMTRIL